MSDWSVKAWESKSLCIELVEEIISREEKADNSGRRNEVMMIKSQQTCSSWLHLSFELAVDV